MQLHVIYMGRVPLLRGEGQDVLSYFDGQPTTAWAFVHKDEAEKALKVLPGLYDMDQKRADSLNIKTLGN